jgi:hypothetical protein
VDHRPVRQRPRAAGGRAGAGQDPRRQDPGHDPEDEFQRIQFTPDLLPADLVGTLVYNPREGSSSPPRRARSSPTSSWPTRSTAPRPRCRARCWRPCRSARSPSATPPSPAVALPGAGHQNPIEQEGTYPLPEAQVDRFMLKLRMGYPTPRGGAQDPGHHGLHRHPRAGAHARGPPPSAARARWWTKSTWTTRSRTTSSIDCLRHPRPARFGLPQIKQYIRYGARRAPPSP